MRDFFNVPLELGDVVACITPGYRDFTRGTVVGFTAKQVRIEYVLDGCVTTTTRYPAAIIAHRPQPNRRFKRG